MAQAVRRGVPIPALVQGAASGDEGALSGGSHFPVSDKTLAGLEGAHCRFGPAAVLTINGEVQTKADERELVKRTINGATS